MRLIDADDIIARIPNNLPYKASVRRVLMQAEEVDAVPVVRCKDCKHFDYINRFNPKTGKIRKLRVCKRIYGAFVGMSKDDFCSCGERKEAPDGNAD